MDMLDTKPEATGKREFNRIRNRSAILDAARECFRERGYDNSTIRDIVRRTGLAAGTFYNYFSSKQDIFAALLTDFLSGLNHNLTECRKSANSAEDFIYFAYLSLFRATASDPWFTSWRIVTIVPSVNCSAQTFSGLPCSPWRTMSGTPLSVACCRRWTKSTCAPLSSG